MRLSGAALLPLMILALLAGFTFWLEQTSQGEPRASGAKARHDPDFWVDRFTLRRFDTKGNLLHALTAKRLEHFPDDDSTEVAAPHLQSFGRRETQTVANTAWLDKEGKHVRLEGDVRVIRPGEGKDPETVITTSVLHVTPDDETAETSAPVTITQGQSVVHGANGMELNNKTRVTVLLGPVEGTIDRKTK